MQCNIKKDLNEPAFFDSVNMLSYMFFLCTHFFFCEIHKIIARYYALYTFFHRFFIHIFYPFHSNTSIFKGLLYFQTCKYFQKYFLLPHVLLYNAYILCSIIIIFLCKFSIFHLYQAFFYSFSIPLSTY